MHGLFIAALMIKRSHKNAKLNKSLLIIFSGRYFYQSELKPYSYKNCMKMEMFFHSLAIKSSDPCPFKSILIIGDAVAKNAICAVGFGRRRKIILASPNLKMIEANMGKC